MMYKRIGILLLLVMGALPAVAQSWVQLAEAGAPFETVRAAFYESWNGRTYERGHGWKQFKRWEWFMEQRTWSSGGRIDRQAFLRALRQHHATRPSAHRSSGVWMPLGPVSWVIGDDGYNPGNGRINAIAEDPQDTSILYVGTPSGGLWRSIDAGSSWLPLTDDFAQLGVSSIIVDPADSDVIYVGTGDGDGFDTYSIGIMKSVDGGLTWSSAGGLSSGAFVVRKMAIDPGNSQVLFAATSDGLFRTTNGGGTWLQLMAGSFHDVKLHPTDHDTVYVCSNHFYRSTDGGNAFVEIDDSDGLADPAFISRYRIGVSPDQPDWVYVLSGNASDGSFEGLYRSTNAGASFSLQTDAPNVFNYSSTGSGGGGQCWYNMAIAVDPNDAEVVYTGGINIWKSTNAGLDLDIVTQWIYGNGLGYVHADIHDLVMVGDRLYTGSDGGIFKSTDHGDNWTDLSAGLSITQFY
ncbi:MAG: glycosyl hydrolase, partial [Saprospiraceae bacterium]|nr:glycosyl hydrolase [Saprospiraceae bacterium]